MIRIANMNFLAYFPSKFGIFVILVYCFEMKFLILMLVLAISAQPLQTLAAEMLQDGHAQRGTLAGIRPGADLDEQNQGGQFHLSRHPSDVLHVLLHALDATQMALVRGSKFTQTV